MKINFIDIHQLFNSQSPLDDGCHTNNRKKRRGVIEKKRRDRINSSLVELKRLVPSAFEKQGSAKLEKAEILQLTVDHLRSLHAKGKQKMTRISYKIFGFLGMFVMHENWITFEWWRRFFFFT